MPEAKAISYVSASQRIISSSPGWPTLFRLNVTYPYEAKVAEDFQIIIQLWQGKNTNVSVGQITIYMPANQTQILLKDQKLQNPSQNETLVIDRTLTINLQKRTRWTISVWYSVKDLNPGGTWIIGSNTLASFQVYPQTNDELTKQLSDLQRQNSDQQNQQYGFLFITAYLTATLGIAVPIVQKRREKNSG